MSDLYKYGVAVHLCKPIIKRAVVDFAVGADWTPAAGDVKISKDGGAAANVTNLPTAIAMGNTAMWDYSLTATEMQAKQIRITVADSATKAVEDTMFEIDTYGNASAQHAVDLNDSVRAGLTALPNAAAGANGGLPLGDANARVDVGKALGTAVTLDANNVLNVSTKYVGGTIQTAGDIPARLPAALTANGNIKASLLEILTTAITESGAGRLAAAFKKLFDVAAPTAQADNLPLNTDYTAARAAKLDNLDVAVSTRLATAGYTAPDNATIAAIAGFVDTEITDIRNRLPAALVGGRMDSNVGAINNNTGGVSALDRSTRTIVEGTVNAGATTTSIPTSSLAPAASVADQFKGRVVIFDENTTTVALRGQATDITANTNTGTLTVTALTTAPVNGDTFVIL